ncbi:MAG: D-alanine--D-alanine ligase [Bacteroidota bacterium]
MKKKIAIVAGGDSGEYIISMKSASIIEKNIDKEKYQTFKIVIKDKNWQYIDSNGNGIPVDKNDFSVNINGEKTIFDCAFITIHGTPGEDGKLQGYFDLLKIPYTCSGQLASAITFNKYFTNQLVSHWGLNVAGNLRIKKGQSISPEFILQNISLPVFVKPNKGGSSLGTFFVDKQEDLIEKIQIALDHDDEALIEEFLPGTELTCGAIRYKGKITAYPVTEIVSKTSSKFFDYEAKYTKGAADEITPARISKELSEQVKDTSKFLYEKFELNGIARFDFIFSNDKLYFLELNTIPGMTEESIVPQQANADGVSISELFSMALEECLNQKE